MLIGLHQALIDMNTVGKNLRDDIRDGRIVFGVDSKQCTETQGAHPSIVNARERFTIAHPLCEEVADARLSARITGGDGIQRLKEPIGIQPENDDEHLQQHQTQFTRANLALKALSNQLNDGRQGLQTSPISDVHRRTPHLPRSCDLDTGE